MHRPIVSDENEAKINRYPGEHFNDKLSSVFLIKSNHEHEIADLQRQVGRLMKSLSRTERSRSDWQAAAIVAMIACLLLVCLIGA